MKIRHLFLLSIASLANAAAQEYCSLVVEVVAPSGRLLSGIPVSVREGDGRVEFGDTIKGEIRFCGLGVKPVTVMVGHSPGCQSIVSDVPLEWQLVRNLRVIYDVEPCFYDAPPPLVFLCSVLIRFSDETGNWVSGVVIKRNQSAPDDLRSDGYGRVMLLARKGEELRAFTSASGFAPQTINFKCSSALTERERRITLRKAQ